MIMKMKKIISALLALALIVSLAACAKKGGETKKNTDAKTSISVCLASEPDTIDPALNSAVDGATLLAHLFSGLAKWTQTDDGKLELAPDAAKELVEGVTNEDGTVTYTYTLKDGLKWSDGKDVTAGDFEFAWQRAASLETAADYGYMFDVVDGYDKVTEADEEGNPVNKDAKLNVKAIDDKTLEVTLANAVPYWNELLAFPTYFPVREDVVSNEGWATDPSTYVSNGLYTLSAWEHNSVITLEKNENHPDVATVKMDTIKCYLSDDANNMLSNFKNGEWQFIDSVPTNEIEAIKADYPDEFYNVGQLGTYYVCWNINKSILPEGTSLKGAEADKAEAEIKQALGLLIDRNYIVDKIAQGGQVPASTFVGSGLTDADGKTEFIQNTGVSDKFVGYFDATADAVKSNYDSAIETLKKYYKFDEASGKFTDFPSITYLYNTDEGHKAIAEYIQSAFANVGIEMKLENQEWATLLNTRKQGNYTVTRNGWLADYNDPISFLDMWTTSSGNNDAQFGKGNYKDAKYYSLDLTKFGYDDKVENGTWAETYDVLISRIKTCTDTENRYAMMHMAEDMVMATGCITPIYYYTDQYMLAKNVNGFFASPLGYKYFMYCTID